MITQPCYTRITLSLDIIRKITQGEFAGYHELQIVKHQIDLHDIITIRPCETMRITCNNPEVPLNGDNICWKITDMVRKQYTISDQVHIDIQKIIPVQGGLAGGSANAACVLMMLNEFWSLKLTKDQLCSIGRKTGMDVSYFFYGKTAIDTEATGCITPVHTACRFDFVLVTPDFGVSTKEAYARIDYEKIAKDTDKTNAMLKTLELNQTNEVLKYVHNDFEKSVFKQYPRLQEITKILIAKECRAAFMSGSGSVVVGVAKDREHALWIQKNLPFKSLVASTL